MNGNILGLAYVVIRLIGTYVRVEVPTIAWRVYRANGGNSLPLAAAAV